MNKKETFVKKLKEIRQTLKQIKEEEKEAQFKTDNKSIDFQGTYDIEKMIGKVGFIDTDGKYYPVRDIIYQRNDQNSDLITHDFWAEEYLHKIKKITGNHSCPSNILIRKYHFAMIIESEVTPNVVLDYVGYQDKLNSKQEIALKKLNEYYQEKGKSR